MSEKHDIKFDERAEAYDEGLEGKLYIADPKLPFPIRNVLNTALEIHRIVGKVYTDREMEENFAPYGFRKLSWKSDSYAQLICLERV